MPAPKMPSFLENPELRLILFGGKGGCGKTTSAAAAGLSLSRLRPGKRTLVVSTDPAHSLADALDCPLNGAAASVPQAENLWAQELDAEELDREFRGRHQGILQEIVERGTYLDRQDTRGLFSLPMPGLDELMAVLRIAEALESGRYDLVILDTAPTGHTLRLLAMPGQMERWNRVLGLMQAKHHHLALAFAGRRGKDEADRFIEGMDSDIKRVRALLKNSRATEFVPVAIPEPMSLYETQRLIEALRGFGVPAKSLIINRVEAGGEGCGSCLARKAAQQECLVRLRQGFASYELVEVPLFAGEVRGRSALLEYCGFLARQGGTGLAPPPEPGPSEPVLDRARAGQSPARGELWRLEEEPGLQFILFGGKGGVGKTTLASSAALHLARRFPLKKVLAVSIDPAHSLSDSLGCRLGEKPAAVLGLSNLDGLEIDAPRRYADFKESYGRLVREAFDGILPRGFEARFDREVVNELTSLLPPGIDELMALSQIMDLVDRDMYGLYVFDTAPTGHLLRFLKLPGLIRQWLKFFLQLLLKYRRSVRLDGLAREMVDLSRNVRELERLFSDRQRTQFVAVTLAEAMPVLETQRLLSQLESLKFSCGHIVVNMLSEALRCPLCSNRRKGQESYLRRIEEGVGRGRFVSTLPLWPGPVGGRERLEEVSRALFGRG